MRRFVLLIAAGVLALSGLPQGMQAQGQPGPTGEAPRHKVRVLAVAKGPLADEHLPEGGLIVALAGAGLSQPGAGDFAGLGIDVRWAKAAPTEASLSDPAIDLTLPVESADCDNPNDLTQSLAVLCDSTAFSEPILQVIVGLFAPADSAFKFDTDESIFGKTICLSQDHDLSPLNSGGRNWATYRRVTVLRRPTLLDCVAAVQGRTAHAFVAADIEGRYLLDRLGMGQAFRMLERPLGTRGVHAVVARQHAKGPELIEALNRGIKQLKQSGAYAALVQRHMMRLWHGPAGAPPAAVAVAKPLPASVPKPALVQPPKPVAVAPAAPPAVPETAKVPPAALLPADRERAQRFLKRGDEELADGRIAPARLFYERAAEMGLAQAAMALAATYDAAELSKRGLRNIPSDAREARRWYERALALGASDAGDRLQRLGAK